MLMLPMLLLAGDPDHLADRSLMAAARAMTSAEQRCRVDPDSTDVTVCGLRHADHFRAPFAAHAMSRADDVPAARATLIHERTPMEEMGPFLVGGGMAGIHATVGGGRTGVGGLRPLAP